MTYNELREYMTEFHLGEMSKRELTIAIGIWQRSIIDFTLPVVSARTYYSKELDTYVTIPV